MGKAKQALLLGSLIVILAGCGGGGNQACAAQTWTFTDPKGSRHELKLFRPFFDQLTEPAYKGHLEDLR